MGWLLAGVFCLSSTVGEGEAAARHRHRARVGAGHLVAQRRGPQRSQVRASRRAQRAALTEAAANAQPDIAFVTITTAAKGTSFYVDSRRVGTGSKVRQSLPPGYHQFQAVHPSGARWQKYLSFDAGDDRELIIHW